MLMIRNAQMRAMEEHDARQFRALVAALLRQKHVHSLGADVPDDYAGRLFDLALSTCTPAGLDDQGSVIEFAEALVKNDTHPLDTDRLNAKAQAVLREFQSRAVYRRLQLIAAASAPPSDGAEADDEVPTQE